MIITRIQEVVDSFMAKLPIPSRVYCYRVDGRSVFDIRSPNDGVTSRQMMYFTTSYNYGVEIPLNSTEGEVRERLGKALKEFEAKIDKTDTFLDDKLVRLE